MARLLIFSTTLFLFCVNAMAVDLWVSSDPSSNYGTLVHISTKGAGTVQTTAAAPGPIRSMAATDDGLFIYVTYTNGQGVGDVAIYNVALNSWSFMSYPGFCNVGCTTDVTQLSIAPTEDILYVGGTNYLGTTVVEKYNIAEASGTRANQWLDEVFTSCGFNDVSFTAQATQFAWGGDSGLCYWDAEMNTTWVSTIGIKALSVLFSPDGDKIVAGLLGPRIVDPAGHVANVWLYSVGLPASPSGALFGGGQVQWLTSVSTRFYGTTGKDAYLYSADFAGTVYVPRLIGSASLTGTVFGPDGKLYVGGSDGQIYPVSLGGSPDKDRVGKPYLMPSGFSPWQIVATNTPSKK